MSNIYDHVAASNDNIPTRLAALEKTVQLILTDNHESSLEIAVATLRNRVDNLESPKESLKRDLWLLTTRVHEIQTRLTRVSNVLNHERGLHLDEANRPE